MDDLSIEGPSTGSGGSGTFTVKQNGATLATNVTTFDFIIPLNVGASAGIATVTVNTFIADIIANRPAAGPTNLGLLYFATDSKYWSYSDGASWTSLLSDRTNGMTGTQLAATISDFDTQVRTSRLDQMATPTADVAWGSKKITGLANGSGAQDAAAFGQIPTALPPNGSASGDLTGSYPGPSIAAAAVSLAKMATLAANSIIGNNTGSPATPIALTVTQIRTLIGLGTAGLLASDTDGTLTANSDSNIATQKATKTYVDAQNSTTQTLTNKRITKRVLSIVSSATPAINTDNYDAVTITALATAITSMTSSLTGTPNNFDTLIFRIKDDGSARAITWGASFAASGVSLPTTTIASKRLTVGFQWSSTASVWLCIASAQE